MKKFNNLFYSFALIIILGINPHACESLARGCHGCSHDASSVSRSAAKVDAVVEANRMAKTQEGADRIASVEIDRIAKEEADRIARVEAERMTKEEADRIAKEEADRIAKVEADKSIEDQPNFETRDQNSERTYTYNNKEYINFNDIPFQSTDKLYFDHALSKGEADYLMRKGVKFVYNNKAYLEQKDKAFKILYLMPDDVGSVKKLYELDDSHAESLKEWSSTLSNSSIIKVSSYEDMVSKQDEILGNDEIPILIFHNSSKLVKLNNFNSQSNFITCNSFTADPEGFLISTTLVDMRAVIEGLNASSTQLNLEAFYNKFTITYYAHMEKEHQKTTLLYLGIGTGVVGGVSAIAYYNQD